MMTNHRHLSRHRHNSCQRRSPGILLGIILIWSIVMGLGFAQAFADEGFSTKNIGTVDPVAEQYALGQSLYLENCATCHIGIPPAVLPTQIWGALLNETEHYGVTLTLPSRFDSRLILDYLSNYSRPYYDTEVPTFTIARSRFFTALHPQVEFPSPANLQTCVSCHPSVEDFNFRQLSPEWQ